MRFIEDITTAIFLSCRLPPVPHVVDWLRILNTFRVATTKTYTVPLDPHIVYCLNIYNTFVVLTTDKPWLFTVVVLFSHILPTIQTNVASLSSTNTKVSAIHWGFYYCCFVYLVVYRRSLTLLIVYVFFIHFSLQRPKPTLYRWTLTLYIV